MEEKYTNIIVVNLKDERYFELATGLNYTAGGSINTH